jgi:hypothetical protein
MRSSYSAGASPLRHLIQDLPSLTLGLSLFGETYQGDLARPLYRHGQYTLVLQTIPGDAPRNNASAFRQKVPQQTDILKIDRRVVDTKSARLTALKKSTASSTAITTLSSFHVCLRQVQLFVFV